MPEENEKDFEDIPANVMRSVELIKVSHMDEVLKNALALTDPDSFLVPVDLPDDGSGSTSGRPTPRPT